MGDGPVRVEATRGPRPVAMQHGADARSEDPVLLGDGYTPVMGWLGG